MPWPVIVGLALIGTGIVLYIVTAIVLVIANAFDDEEPDWLSEYLADEELD